MPSKPSKKPIEASTGGAGQDKSHAAHEQLPTLEKLAKEPFEGITVSHG
jgi:hypothetical protein